MNMGDFRDKAIAFLDERYAKWFNPTHEWGKPQIRIFYDNEVWFSQYCSQCGSKRNNFIEHRSYMTGHFSTQIKYRFWLHSPRIKYSKRYRESICRSRYEARHPKESRSFKVRRALAFRKVMDERHRLAEQRRFRDLQFTHNVRIVRQFGGQRLKWRSVERLRRDLAVYRLNRYCDFSDKKIAEAVGLSVEKVKRIIGSTFRLLCMSDTSCIYRNIFFEDTG